MSYENTEDELEISPAAVAELIATDPSSITLVDVREEWELTRGVLPGAVHRPLSRFADYVDAWPREGECVIYCEHGVRSLDATLWLLQNKGIRTRSMRGGFADWSGPVEKFPPAGGAA
jgi:rhodanese-related sulfurtransferase